MEDNKRSRTLLLKLMLIALLSLIMLIPMAMIKDRIEERESTMRSSIEDVESSWGQQQTICGPTLENADYILFPDSVKYDATVSTQILHRSIYDVTVYTAQIRITGCFIPTDGIKNDPDLTAKLELSDLKGIQGSVRISLGEKQYEFLTSGTPEYWPNSFSSPSISADIVNEWQHAEDGTVIPFEIDMTLKGSEAMMFKPVGDITEASMTSDCPTPSFIGEFLPSKRDIREDGFTTDWNISQINRGTPESTSFGVKFIQPVTQYQQTTRSAKYAILIILLVFLAGLLVEFLTGREINIIQYIVIGLSLVLFYALLLAFSEFMTFGRAYLTAMVMTVSALTAYFRAILKSSSAWLLSVLVVFAYSVSYVLLQMETFAFLTGTLILFILLCVIMYFTRNLSERTESGSTH